MVYDTMGMMAHKSIFNPMPWKLHWKLHWKVNWKVNWKCLQNIHHKNWKGCLIHAQVPTKEGIHGHPMVPMKPHPCPLLGQNPWPMELSCPGPMRGVVYLLPRRERGVKMTTVFQAMEMMGKVLIVSIMGVKEKEIPATTGVPMRVLGIVLAVIVAVAIAMRAMIALSNYRHPDQQITQHQTQQQLHHPWEEEFAASCATIARVKKSDL
jgi:hypothetical protein